MSDDSDPTAMRDLAAWYRRLTERAGSPWIWERGC